MKKLITIVVTLSLFLGVTGGANQFVNAKEVPEEYVVETEEYSQEQKEQLKKADYTFSEKELMNTPYEGQKVEVIDGKLYVDGKIVWSVVIWFFIDGFPYVAGWMAAGGVIMAADGYNIRAELRNQLKHAYNRFSNMTDAYAENQKLKSVKLSNGNECVPTSATTYVCKYSV